MCHQSTPADKIVPCSRCGKPANPSDNWVHGWPLHGNIVLGFPSCHPLNVTGHLAIHKNDPQCVEIHWGEDRKYRLCYDCQETLIDIVGLFFNISKK